MKQQADTEGHQDGFLEEVIMFIYSVRMQFPSLGPSVNRYLKTSRGLKCLNPNQIRNCLRQSSTPLDFEQPSHFFLALQVNPHRQHTPASIWHGAGCEYEEIVKPALATEKIVFIPESY